MKIDTIDTPHLKGIPVRIWLCCGDLDPEEETHFESITGEDLCWTQHGPNDDTDPAYILESTQAAEIEQLRAIFPEILKAIGNGSWCTGNNSLEFLQSIPNEVSLVVRDHTAEIERLKGEVQSLTDWGRKHAVVSEKDRADLSAARAALQKVRTCSSVPDSVMDLVKQALAQSGRPEGKPLREWDVWVRGNLILGIEEYSEALAERYGWLKVRVRETPAL